MNGPQHYREAERLLGDVNTIETNIGKSPLAESKARADASARCIALAGVHATLALAAATAKPLTKDEPEGVEGGNEPRNWFEVLRP